MLDVEVSQYITLYEWISMVTFRLDTTKIDSDIQDTDGKSDTYLFYSYPYSLFFKKKMMHHSKLCSIVNTVRRSHIVSIYFIFLAALLT